MIGIRDIVSSYLSLSAPHFPFICLRLPFGIPVTKIGLLAGEVIASFVVSFWVVADDECDSDVVGWGSVRPELFEDDTADEGADIEYIPRDVLVSKVVMTS